MVMDIRDTSKIIILEETDWNGAVFKTERRYIVSAADDDGLYVPGDATKEIIKKSKTRFFRIRAKQGEIILTPIKIQLEVVEGEEGILNGSGGGSLGGCEDSQKLKELGEI